MAVSKHLADISPTTIKSAVEQEIKLQVDRHFRLPDLQGEPLPRRVLTSTYYDTVHYRLARAKITLRRRTESRKHAWQLKLPMEGARREIEMSDPGGTPPVALQRLLVLPLEGEPLLPVAALRTWRTGMRVRGPNDACADVVLDTVSVLKDRHVVHSFREVEIERQSGDDALPLRLKEVLRKSGARDHDGRPKVFRALELPLPKSPVPPPAESPTIEHVKFALATYLEALRSHDPGVRLGGFIEDLHEMRVAARRLRAILRAARPLLVPGWSEPLRNELDWLGVVLGPARDLDVQVGYFQEEAAALDSRDRKPLERFVAHLRSEREKAQQALLTALGSERYFELIRNLTCAAIEPAVVSSTVSLSDIAAGAFAKLRKAMRKLDGAPTDSALHRLRIQTKRARYAAELAETCSGHSVTRFILEAKAFQDLLGLHQDAVLAERHIREFLQQSTSVRAAFVAGRMVERQRHRRESARLKLRTEWKKLEKRGKKAWA